MVLKFFYINNQLAQQVKLLIFQGSTYQMVRSLS